MHYNNVTVYVILGILFIVSLVTFVFACIIPADSIAIIAPSEGSKVMFDDSSPGEKTIPCNATASPSEREPYISWSCKDVSGSQEIWHPDPPVDKDPNLELNTLPTNNSAFGDTWIKASVDSVSDTHTIKLFFTEEASNNPGGEHPNWYFYWSQTSADYGTHNYDPNSPNSWTDFIDGAWRSRIGYNSNDDADAGTWDNAEGIDFFAHVCRHEERHRQDMSSLWGAGNNRTAEADPDVDGLPTDNGTVTENSLGTPYHAGGYDPADADTIADHFNYGVGWKDSEDYALHRQAAWTNGTADASDWAKPGHQWPD